MPNISEHRQTLRVLPPSDWEPYLLAHSNLPGPRGNLELAQAVADVGSEAQLSQWASLGPDVAPENTPECFLAFCGVVGLGVSLARRGGFASINAPTTVDEEPAIHGRPAAAQENPPLRTLRPLAADPRWRIREAVAMALQRWGDADMPALLAEMADWARGNPWEQRAAAAALCEPRLLKQPEHSAAVLRILDEITASIPPALAGLRPSQGEREAFKTLRQGLAYCWSVAVVALPDAGKPLMEKWLANSDPDIRWIMRENLKKNRLAKMDAEWVARWM
jgi:hypothetical protein